VRCRARAAAAPSILAESWLAECDPLHAARLQDLYGSVRSSATPAAASGRARGIATENAQRREQPDEACRHEYRIGSAFSEPRDRVREREVRCWRCITEAHDANAGRVEADQVRVHQGAREHAACQWVGASILE
jgi:hypothetical protein